MDAASWNAIADHYSDEVLSVFENDTHNVVAKHLKRLGSDQHTVADIGCGPGNFLPLLATLFKSVHAIDFSSALLKKAEQQCMDASHENVRFHRINLCKKLDVLPYPKVNLALCVNALLEPSLTGRLHMWDKLRKSVVRGGYLLLVVPALESALLAHTRLVHWILDEGRSPHFAVRHEFSTDDAPASTPQQILREGVLETGGTLTKHFFQEELNAELPRHGFEITEISKLEYDWRTEFANPPKDMQEPYPWDWTVLARKVAI